MQGVRDGASQVLGGRDIDAISHISHFYRIMRYRRLGGRDIASLSHRIFRICDIASLSHRIFRICDIASPSHRIFRICDIAYL